VLIEAWTLSPHRYSGVALSPRVRGTTAALISSLFSGRLIPGELTRRNNAAFAADPSCVSGSSSCDVCQGEVKPVKVRCAAVC